MYAIVKAGGRQEKVAVGDEFELDRVTSGAGETFTLPALLLVDGDAVTLAVDEGDAASVAAASLSGPVALVVRG